MSPVRKPSGGLDLSDDLVVARLDAVQVPAVLVLKFVRLGVSVSLVERVAGCGYGWSFVESLTQTRGMTTAEDVAALVTLHGMDTPPGEVSQWAHLGSLDAAVRLLLKMVSLDTVQKFPLDADHGTDSFLRMMQTISTAGIHADDVLWWYAGGVLRLSPPYLVPGVWAAWRSVAATRLGMRRAAVAAAAGFSPREAVAMVEAGEFDMEAVSMLAGLRAANI